MQSERSAKVFGDKEDPRKRIDDIFADGDPSTDTGRLAEQWARNTLRDVGIQADLDPVGAVACLRTAEPRLTLRTATFLVNNLPNKA